MESKLPDEGNDDESPPFASSSRYPDDSGPITKGLLMIHIDSNVKNILKTKLRAGRGSYSCSPQNNGSNLTGSLLALTQPLNNSIYMQQPIAFEQGKMSTVPNHIRIAGMRPSS
jgi:hypothetical protein